MGTPQDKLLPNDPLGIDAFLGTSAPTDPNESALSDPRVTDFLDRVGKGEGADYHTLVGGSKIADLSRHPNIVGLTTAAGPSTAFGKYQITGTTNRTKLGKYAHLDYSPRNQDLRAVELLRQTGALDALMNDQASRAVKLAGKEWASIPGSSLPGRKNNAAWSGHPGLGASATPKDDQEDPLGIDAFLAQQPDTPPQLQTTGVSPEVSEMAQISETMDPVAHASDKIRGITDKYLKIASGDQPGAVAPGFAPNDPASQDPSQPTPRQRRMALIETARIQWSAENAKAAANADPQLASKLLMEPFNASPADVVKWAKDRGLGSFNFNAPSPADALKARGARFVAARQMPTTFKESEDVIKSHIRQQVMSESGDSNPLDFHPQGGGVNRSQIRDQMPSDAVEQEVQKRYEQYQRSVTPEMIKERAAYGSMPWGVRAIAAPVRAATGDVIGALGNISNMFGLHPNEAGDYLEDSGRFMREAANAAPIETMKMGDQRYVSLDPKFNRDIEKQLPEKIVSKAVSTGVGIAELVALKNAFPQFSMGQIMGAESFAKNYDLPLNERALEAAKSFAFGKVLDQHLSRPVSALVFGGPSAVESGKQYLDKKISLSDAILNTLGDTALGAAFGGKGLLEPIELAAVKAVRAEGTPEWLRSQLVKLTDVENVVFHDGERAMSTYVDPKTRDIGGTEIGLDSAEKRQTIKITPEQFDQLSELVKSRKAAKESSLPQLTSGVSEPPRDGGQPTEPVQPNQTALGPDTPAIPPRPDTPRVPESAATIEAHMDALMNGRRKAVVISPGTELPEIPPGFKASETTIGTVIYPSTVTRGQLRKVFESGEFYKWLGHVNPESPEATVAVVARSSVARGNVKPGDEVGASYVVPGNEEAAKASLLAQHAPYHPTIEVGGQQTANAVMQQRIEEPAPVTGPPAKEAADLSASDAASPSTSPETIVTAAIRDDDGTVTTGVNHPQILLSQGKKVPKDRSGPEYGFVTSTGRFVTRAEAATIAGIPNTIAPGQLYTEDITAVRKVASAAGNTPGTRAPAGSASTKKASAARKDDMIVVASVARKSKADRLAKAEEGGVVKSDGKGKWQVLKPAPQPGVVAGVGDVVPEAKKTPRQRRLKRLAEAANPQPIASLLSEQPASPASGKGTEVGDILRSPEKRNERVKTIVDLLHRDMEEEERSSPTEQSENRIAERRTKGEPPQEAVALKAQPSYADLQKADQDASNRIDDRRARLTTQLARGGSSQVTRPIATELAQLERWDRAHPLIAAKFEAQEKRVAFSGDKDVNAKAQQRIADIDSRLKDLDTQDQQRQAATKRASDIDRELASLSTRGLERRTAERRVTKRVTSPQLEQPVTKTTERRTATAKRVIRHSDPNIDGGEIVGTATDGRLKVKNKDGKNGGISLVQDPRKQGNREAAIATIKEESNAETVRSDQGSDVERAPKLERKEIEERSSGDVHQEREKRGQLESSDATPRSTGRDQDATPQARAAGETEPARPDPKTAPISERIAEWKQRGETIIKSKDATALNALANEMARAYRADPKVGDAAGLQTALSDIRSILARVNRPKAAATSEVTAVDGDTPPAETTAEPAKPNKILQTRQEFVGDQMRSLEKGADPILVQRRAIESHKHVVKRAAKPRKNNTPSKYQEMVAFGEATPERVVEVLKSLGENVPSYVKREIAFFQGKAYEVTGKKLAGRVGLPKNDPTSNSLSVEARARGGVKPDPDGDNAGELRMLKETGPRGLVDEKNGQTVESMAMTLAQEGYGVGLWSGLGVGNGIDSGKFLESLAEDAAGSTKHYSTAYDAKMEDEPDFKAFESLAGDDYGKEMLELVQSGNARAADIAELAQVARQHGVSDQGLQAFLRSVDDTVKEELQEAPRASEAEPNDQGYSLDKDGTLVDPDGQPLFALSSPQQLGFVAEGLTQQDTRPSKAGRLSIPRQQTPLADSRLQRLSEDSDPGVRRGTKLLAQRPNRDPAKINDVATALDKLSSLRATHTPVRDYLRERSLFGDETELTPEQNRLVQGLDRATPLQLRKLIDSHLGAEQPIQSGLFGLDARTPKGWETSAPTDEEPPEIRVNGNQVIFVGSQPARLLAALMKRPNAGGVFFETPDAEKLAGLLDRLASFDPEQVKVIVGSTTFDPVPLAKEMSEAIAKAVAHGSPGVIITAEGHLAHELFHESMRRLGVDVEGLTRKPSFEKIKTALIKIGYPNDPNTLVQEGAAFIAEGRRAELGLTVAEATDWMKALFDSVLEKNPDITADRFKELAHEAQQALNQAIHTQAATAKSRSDGQSVRSLQGGRGTGPPSALTRNRETPRTRRLREERERAAVAGDRDRASAGVEGQQTKGPDSLAGEPRTLGEPAHSINITPAMKKSVMEGQPMFALDPWDDLSQVINDLGNVKEPNAKEIEPGEIKERATPGTLEAGGLEGGEDRYYNELTNEASRKYADDLIDAKGLDDSAAELSRLDIGSEKHTALSIALLRRFHEEAEEAEQSGDMEGAAESYQKAMEAGSSVAGDLARRSTEYGQAIQLLGTINQYSPTGLIVKASRLSIAATGDELSVEQMKQFTDMAKKHQALEGDYDALEKQLAAMSEKVKKLGTPRQQRQARESKPSKFNYQVKLDQQAAKAHELLSARIGNLDLGRLVMPTAKPGERGRLDIGFPPLEGDAELLAQYAASRLSKVKNVEELDTEMFHEFGREIQPYLSTIRKRAWQIRKDARIAEIESEESDNSQRRTILSEIRAEVAEAEREVAQQKLAEERDRKAREKEIATEEKGQARSAAKEASKREREQRQQIAKDSRQRLDQLRQEQRDARKADERAWRGIFKGRREGQRIARLWDTPVRNAALAARERLEGGEQPPAETLTDLAAVGAERLLPTKPGASPGASTVTPEQFYAAMRDEFPDLVTDKNQGEILKRAHQIVHDTADAATEAAHRRSDMDALLKEGLEATPENIAALREHRARTVAERRQAQIAIDRALHQLSVPLRNKIGQTIAANSRDSLLSYAGMLRVGMGMTAKQIIDTNARFAASVIDNAWVRLGQIRGVEKHRVEEMRLRDLIKSMRYLTTQGPRHVMKGLKGEDSEVMRGHRGPWDNPYVNFAISPMMHQYGGIKEALIRSWAFPDQLYSEYAKYAENDVLDGLIRRGEKAQRARDYAAGRIQFEGGRNLRYAQDFAPLAAEYEAKTHAIFKSMIPHRDADLQSTPTELAHSLAKRYADHQVYGQPNAISQKIQKLKGDSAFLDVIQAQELPFTTRPITALNDFIYTYTGLKVPGTVIEAAIRKARGGKGWNSTDRQKIQQAVARGGAGYGLYMMGYLLAGMGLLTATGILKLWGHEINIGRVPLLGWILTAGATHKTKGAKAIPGALWHVIKDYPYLGAVRDLGKLITDVDNIAKDEKTVGEKLLKAVAYHLGDLIGRQVPALLRATAETSDTWERETRGSIWSPAEAKIPIMRKWLPVKITPLGQDIPKNRLSFFDPLKIDAGVTKTPAMLEMERLSLSPKLVRRFSNETAESYHARVVAEGEAALKELEDTIQEPWYRALKTKEEKKQALQEAIKNGRLDARDKLGFEPPEKEETLDLP